jgi:hypothetical protein
MLSVIIQSVIMLNVIMLSVVAPLSINSNPQQKVNLIKCHRENMKEHHNKYKYDHN